MKKYKFTLTLQEPLELTDEIADALFEAGCSDGTPRTTNGGFVIDFNREAASMNEAIRSAIQNVEAAGFEVDRVVFGPEAMHQFT